MTQVEQYLEAMRELRQRVVPAKPGYYAGIEDYLLQKGHAYESRMLTPREHLFVRALRKRSQFPQKQCFANAQRVVLDLTFHGAPDGIPVQYAEGFVLCHDLPLPIHHAWLDVGGKVVDLTLRTRAGRGLRAVGTFKDVDYFGATFGVNEVRAFVVATKCYGSLLDDWQRGFPYLQIGYQP